MVDSIKPTHSTIPIRRDQNAQAVESHSDEKQGSSQPPVKYVKDRRRNPDRRNNERSASRGKYELRSGKDRRKGDDNYPSIEIDV